MSSVTATFIHTYCIALTGGIATGKSSVAHFIKQYGIPVFDADECARSVVAPGRSGLEQLRSAFGSVIIHADGTLDRAQLRARMSHDPNAKAQLDLIMHPLIRDEFIRQIDASDLTAKPRIFFYEAALIHETGRAKDFKAVWCTLCSLEVQRSRLRARSGGTLSESDITALIATQMPASAKAALSDVVIDTSLSLAQVEQQLIRLLTAEGALPKDFK